MLIALANSKGGVGKSTIAVHLAALAHEQGLKVAFIDADAQQSGSRWLRDLQAPFPVHRLTTPEEVIEQADEIDRNHQLTVADGPAGLSEVTRAVLMVCDLALLPCGPSALDLHALQDALRTLRQAQKIRQGPPRAVVVPNKLQAGYRLSRELVEAAPNLGVPCVEGLRLRQAYAEAAGQGSVVWRLGRYAEEAAKEIRNLFSEIQPNETKNAR